MKKIRSNFVKESLMDYANLAQTLKENSSSVVKDLLKETVLDTYSQLLSEDDDKEYDEEEVEDTKSGKTKTDTNKAKKSKEILTDDMEGDGDEEMDANQMQPAQGQMQPQGGQMNMQQDQLGQMQGQMQPQGEMEMGDASMPEDEDEWAEFEKYKVDGSDDEYDFSEAKDEDVVKVYKLLKDQDQVLVNVDKSANRVQLVDNETESEYIIELGGDEEATMGYGDMEGEGNLDYTNNMNESRFFELVLNEYDSHVGYTDDYQKHDVMTTPDMSEPGKNVNDWDAGVPKSKAKPWAGSTGKGKPFNEEEMSDEDTLFEVDMFDEDDDSQIEEGTNVGGYVQQNSVSKSHIPTSNGRKARNSSKGGKKTKGTSTPRYSSSEESLDEARVMAKVNSIISENNALKNALGQFKKTLKEAAVVNVNLGQIIKLLSENSTTAEEKKEIIARFGKQAKTVNESKALFETINKELKRRQTMNINEDKQFTATPNKMINETQIYSSKAVMNSLDLMSRICK